MVLFLREMAKNRKYVIIWTSSLILLNIMMMAFYPYMDIKTMGMEEMLKQMPKGLTSALSLTNLDFSNIINYFAYEFQYVLLFSCIFAMMFGASILSKEESEKTIEFLMSKPVTRNEIVGAKAMCLLVYLLIYNILFTATNYGIFEAVKTQSYSLKVFFAIQLGQLLAQLTFAATGFIISIFVVKAKTVLPVSLGVVLGSFFISMASAISEKLADLKYLTPFKYVNPADIAAKEGLETVYVIIMGVVVVVAITSTFVLYRKKNITV